MKVIISRNSEYCGGDYIPGRHYSGVYGGTFYEDDGCYIKVDSKMVKITNEDKVIYEK